ncbi:MAG: hypothetical protein HZA31_11480 [Opitutae bacterium]|nr:hypothetical protein [Opitutae bacterium]
MLSSHQSAAGIAEIASPRSVNRHWPGMLVGELGKIRTHILLFVFFASCLLRADEVLMRVSEDDAEALVKALPEYAALKRKYASHPMDIYVDSEGKRTFHIGNVKERTIWCITVYVTGPGYDAWGPWERFGVDIHSGEIFVGELDFDAKSMEEIKLKYEPLECWRRCHKRPNR